MKLLICIIYDGIKNSVFQSQVLTPLQKKIAAHEYDKIILISFESLSTDKQQLTTTIQQTNNLQLIILHKLPFIGPISLWFALLQLKFKLHAITEPFDLLVRGPLAGWLAKKITKHTLCNSVTIQARGLLAAEYEYTHQNKRGVKQLVHKFRAQQFHQLEKNVYSPDFPDSSTPLRSRSEQSVKNLFWAPIKLARLGKKVNKTVIEAVSPALKEYLVATFAADAQQIIIAQYDIPTTFTHEQLQQWRNTTRALLNIPADAYVYCYNGSALPWQCPHETIQFFKKKADENKNVFLLVLSQDATTFKTLAQQHLQKEQYTVTSVAHKEIYHYLAAADAGILFREKNILNWVSRPTKVLEYQSVGLKIIHNKTVAMLEHSHQ